MKLLVDNKRAFFDYSILEEMTAGLVLSGAEVKSLKSGQGSLKGSYISLKNNQAYLVKAHITPYKYAGAAKSDPEKDRKLLLNRKEIDSLVGKEKATVIIPLGVYLANRGLIKLKIGIAKSKKQFDKRASIKKRETERRIRKQED